MLAGEYVQLDQRWNMIHGILVDLQIPLECYCKHVSPSHALISPVASFCSAYFGNSALPAFLSTMKWYSHTSRKDKTHFLTIIIHQCLKTSSWFAPVFWEKEHGNPRNKGSLFRVAMCNIISLPAIGKKEHEGEISSLTVPKKGDF